MISEAMLKQLEKGATPSKIRVTIEFNPEFNQQPQTFELDKFHLELSAKPEQKWEDGKLIMSISSERRVKISGTLLDRPKFPVRKHNE
jgi:hypothetical protein